MSFVCNFLYADKRLIPSFMAYASAYAHYNRLTSTKKNEVCLIFSNFVKKATLHSTPLTEKMIKLAFIHFWT